MTTHMNVNIDHLVCGTGKVVTRLVYDDDNRVERGQELGAPIILDLQRPGPRTL